MQGKTGWSGGHSLVTFLLSIWQNWIVVIVNFQIVNFTPSGISSFFIQSLLSKFPLKVRFVLQPLRSFTLKWLRS